MMRINSPDDLPPGIRERNRGKFADDMAATQAPGLSKQLKPAAPEATQGRADEAVAVKKDGGVMLPYPVALNRAYRNFRGRMVMSTEAREWKEQASTLAKSNGITVLSGPVSVSIILHPKAKKDGTASKTRIDQNSAFSLLRQLHTIR